MCGTCCSYCRNTIKTNKDIPVDLGLLPFHIRDNIPVVGASGVKFNQLVNIKFCTTGKFSKFSEKNLVKDTRCKCKSTWECLNCGKRVVQTVCETFGGIYVTEWSGQTTMLVVGDEPGQVKFKDAKSCGADIVSLRLEYIIV